MSDLEELYQATLLEHSRNPHHRGTLERPTHHAEVLNPLCGDRVSLDLILEDGRIQQVAFEGEGCILSQAAASMITEAILGQTLEQIQHLDAAFLALVGANEPPEDMDHLDLGDLTAFRQVRAFPTRVRCATLPWRTLEKALHPTDQEKP